MGASSNKGGMGGPNTRAPGGGGMDYNGNPVGGGMGAQFNFGGPGNNLQGRSLPGNMFRGAGNLFGGAIDRGLNRPQPGQPLPPGVSKGFGMPPQQSGGFNPPGPGVSKGFGMPPQQSGGFNPPGGTGFGVEEDNMGGYDNSARLGTREEQLAEGIRLEQASADPTSVWYKADPSQRFKADRDINSYVDDGRGSITQAPAPVNRFQPQGMIPPAGSLRRPQPGQMTGPYTRQRYPSGDPRRYANQGGVPPGGPQPGMPAPTPMPSPPQRGKGGGGGKGGMPGPGGQFPGGINPVFNKPPMFIDNFGNPTRDHGGGANNMNINRFNPAYRDDGGGGDLIGHTGDAGG